MKKVCPKVIYLKPYPLFSSLGFTLIELLVVLVISILLLGIGVAAYNNFNQKQILNQAVSTLRTDLRDAQNRALSGEKPTTPPCDTKALDGYQVTFDDTSNPNRYTIQARCGGGAGTIKTINLSGVRISGLPATNPIIFKSLAHGTNIQDTATITLQNPSIPDTRDVIVSASGDVR